MSAGAGSRCTKCGSPVIGTELCPSCRAQHAEDMFEIIKRLGEGQAALIKAALGFARGELPLEALAQAARDYSAIRPAEDLVAEANRYSQQRAQSAMNAVRMVDEAKKTGPPDIS